MRPVRQMLLQLLPKDWLVIDVTTLERAKSTAVNKLLRLHD